MTLITQLFYFLGIRNKQWNKFNLSMGGFFHLKVCISFHAVKCHTGLPVWDTLIGMLL